MVKHSPLSTGKEKSKRFDFKHDDNNFENSRPKSTFRFELLLPVLSQEWLNVPAFHGQSEEQALDDDDFEEHTRRFVPATTAADSQKCIKLFEDFVFAASVPDLCLSLLYINFEHRCSTLGCVV